MYFYVNLKNIHMKKILLLMTFVGLSNAAFAQWTEDFEGTWPPEGWTIETSNADFTWEAYDVNPINGDTSANVEYDPDLDEQDESLISPSFTVPTADAMLTFNTSLSYNWAVTEGNYDFIVSISTDGGDTWTEIWDETDLGEFENFVVIPVEVDLSAYAGETAQLSFQYVGADGAQLILDDIVVEGSMGLNELNSSFSVYPNPTSNIINISNTTNILLEGAQIIDMNGRTVKTVSLAGVSETQINISDLSSGIYMMNLSSDQGMVTKKIIKK